MLISWGGRRGLWPIVTLWLSSTCRGIERGFVPYRPRAIYGFQDANFFKLEINGGSRHETFFLFLHCFATFVIVILWIHEVSTTQETETSVYSGSSVFALLLL